MEYTWEINSNVEYWQHDIFESAEECMLDAKENYGLKTGDKIAIGIVEPYEVNVDADTVLEELEENAYNQCGEYAESWEPTAEKTEDKEKLSEQLTAIVKEWLEKHNNMPGFYNVVEVRVKEIS